MKKYTIPEIKISSFSVEDIITDSAVGTAATEAVKKQMNDAGIVSVQVEDWANME